MRAAVIEAGRVANIIEIEALGDLLGLELVEVSGGVAIGDLYDGDEFSEAPEDGGPVPQMVSRFQARAAMLAAPATADGYGNLLEQIDAAVAASDNAFIRLAWAEAVEWRRDSPTVNALASSLGVTDEQLDALFRAAAGISA
jgi:hypothetical protein